MIDITTPSEFPQTIQTIQLDGSTYRLRLTWLARRSSWYMDLESLDGTRIMMGRRISPGGIPIPRGVVGAPRGTFFVTGSKDPYEQSDLGTSMILQYVPQEEYETIEGIVEDERFEDLTVVIP